MGRTGKAGRADPEQADRLERLIRERGEYGHIQVRCRAGHLVIESCDANGAEPVARLTPLGGGTYGLGFYNHSGRWEPMPIRGPMEQVVDDLIETLRPYLERMDF